WSRELRRVQKIESLVAELHLPFFTHSEFFEERKVPGLLRRGVEQRNTGVAITPGTEKGAFPRAAVALPAEERRPIRPSIDRAAVQHAAYGLTGYDVRPWVRLRSGVLRIACLGDRHRQSGSELQDSVDRPAAQQPALRPFHAAQPRDFPDVGENGAETLVDLR